MEQAVAKKQAEVFRIILRQIFLFVSQRKDGVRKVGFTIIADRVDVPCLRRIFLAVLLRRDSTHLHRSAEAVKVREARSLAGIFGTRPYSAPARRICSMSVREMAAKSRFFAAQY